MFEEIVKTDLTEEEGAPTERSVLKYELHDKLVLSAGHHGPDGGAWRLKFIASMGPRGYLSVAVIVLILAAAGWGTLFVLRSVHAAPWEESVGFFLWPVYYPVLCVVLVRFAEPLRPGVLPPAPGTRRLRAAIARGTFRRTAERRTERPAGSVCRAAR